MIQKEHHFLGQNISTRRAEENLWPLVAFQIFTIQKMNQQGSKWFTPKVLSPTEVLDAYVKTKK